MEGLKFAWKYKTPAFIALALLSGYLYISLLKTDIRQAQEQAAVYQQTIETINARAEYARQEMQRNLERVREERKQAERRYLGYFDIIKTHQSADADVLAPDVTRDALRLLAGETDSD
jgi:hypothetical protein